MVSVNWETPLPTNPDPTFIVAQYIDKGANEQQIRQPFEFCGEIESIEIKEQDKEHNQALIKFKREAAAKTALLLSEVQVNNVEIKVQALFPQTHEAGAPPSYERTDTQSSAAHGNYEGKPALYVAHELLAAGYMMGERVLSRASQFDAQYRVSDRTQTQARSLDTQYKFSDYLQKWDDKFKISNRAKAAYDKLQSNSLGQKAIFTVNDAYQSALQLHNDARQIAERKRAGGEKLFGKIPLPRAPTASSSSSSAGPANPAPYVSNAAAAPPPAARAASNDYASSPVAPTQPPAQNPDEKQQPPTA
ncbi:Protein vip1 [Coemansia sp. RSA 2702]|nr:Protein vip1 [Coemansia sp. RSA 2705]KAJ2327078.1 Protein vip1 [Coemansia sp. RSA 2702]KAJ2368793.1 Protein vip1 [Coemansia sp. RSA 2610]